MKRAEALALIRRAGYLNNFKTMIEVMVKHRISYEVAKKEFNAGVLIKEKEEFNFDSKYQSGVLSND